MFEFTVEKEQEARKLSGEKAKEIAGKVGHLWTLWDNARKKQKSIAEKLKPELYLDERNDKKVDKDDEWKSDVHLNKLYSLNQTQQAFIWDNIYSNVESLFDVEGADEQSEKMAQLQKSNLVDAFHKMSIKKKLDAGVEHLGAVGEMCLFISWKKKYKQVRRRLDAFADMSNLVYGSSAFGVFNQEIYNGANVDAINPLDLVFDPHVNPEDSEKWDTCGKIIKTWETYDTIANNKLYKLSKAQLQELKEKLNADADDKDDFKTRKVDNVIDDNRIEVLQYWGDYTLEDGTTLRNWYIVSIGREYLAVFEHNRWVINPIINCATVRDAESKRGIPELWSIYDLCKEQEKKVNLQNDAQALNLNPPAYAPEGFFKENKVKLCPGKQVEYKQGLEDPSAIIKMSFPLLSNENIIQYYDEVASSVSGIFPNMQGQDEEKNVTATEIKVKVQGQTTRLSKILDTIKQNIIVPMVEKVAELEANMRFGESEIFVNQNNIKTSQIIGDEVRQGNYEYKYTDNSGIQKKLALNQTLTQILTPVWNDPAVPLNKPEVVKEALNNAGIENADKYLSAPNNMPMMGSVPTPPSEPEINPQGQFNPEGMTIGQVNPFA